MNQKKSEAARFPLASIRAALPWALCFGGTLGGCALPNRLDDGPLAHRIVNDRWVHPRGQFSYRVTLPTLLPNNAEEMVKSDGGRLIFPAWYRTVLFVEWGANARRLDDDILAEIQRRSPGAVWVKRSELDIDGASAELMAAWVPKPGANKEASSVFGFERFDHINVFLRFEKGGVPFFVAREIRVRDSGDAQRAGIPHDHVASFIKELKQHRATMREHADAISFDDPVLDWFREAPSQYVTAPPGVPVAQEG